MIFKIHKFGIVFLIILSNFNFNLLSKKNISVLGTGYVGLVLGACLAKFNHKVICTDIDKAKIASLNNGQIPIFEPGLQELIDSGIKNDNLSFTDNLSEAIQKSEVIFIAVGTPMLENGAADLSYIKSAAKTIGNNLNKYKVICTKSTVPIGTNNLIKEIIRSNSNITNVFDVISNPEFLREGSAIDDFLNPDRVVIGTDSEKARNIINEIYQPLIKQNIPFVYTNTITAETIKYVANSFLATKLSFINEIADLCDKTGAHIDQVSKGIGLDKRIGEYFLNPGPGFGGSCFPKDVMALNLMSQKAGISLKLIQNCLKINAEQPKKVLAKIKYLVGDNLKDKTIAILGLAFKANTDDVRYSPAISIIKKLHQQKAVIKAYDPVAIPNMRKQCDFVEYCNSIEEAAKDSDAIVIATEWPEFKTIDLNKLKQLMKYPIIIDTRNVLSTKVMKKLEYRYLNMGNAIVAKNTYKLTRH